MTISPAPTDFAAILAGSPQPYLVLDAELRIVGASDVYLALTDRERDAIVGRHILEAFPENPDAAGTVEQGPLEVSLRHVLATGRQHEMAVIQYDIPQPGGGFRQKFWTPVHSPVLGADGAVRYIIQNPTDVTESVLRDREADARLRIALHAADLGTWEYEPETDMWRRSPAVDALFGFKPGEAGSLAAPFFARMHPDDLPGVIAAVRATTESPDQTLLRFDYRIVDPAGTVRHVASRGEVLRTSSGTSRMIGVLMDVTADRLREAALGQALDAQGALLVQKDALLAEVNHRVKNSLQLVVSVLSLQARRLGDPAARTAANQAISRVRAITSVHERLYRDEDPLLVTMDDFLKDLCADLVEGSALENRAEVRVEPLRLRTEQAIPIALIVNELVTDMLHRGGEPGDPGSLTLFLRPLGDALLELGVENEGAGPCGPVAGDLGSRLVEAMAVQIEGRIETRRTEGGHRTAVIFPRRDE